MASMLEKIRKLNWVLQESPKGVFSFNDMCEILKDLMKRPDVEKPKINLRYR